MRATALLVVLACLCHHGSAGEEDDGLDDAPPGMEKISFKPPTLNEVSRPSGCSGCIFVQGGSGACHIVASGAGTDLGLTASCWPHRACRKKKSR